MAEGNGGGPEFFSKPNQPPDKIGGRWDFLKKAKEKYLPSLGKDRTYQLGSEGVQVSWKEFTPKEGQIADPEEAVLYLVGAPMRAKSSLTWDVPEQLTEEFKVRTYSIC